MEILSILGAILYTMSIFVSFNARDIVEKRFADSDQNTGVAMIKIICAIVLALGTLLICFGK